MPGANSDFRISFQYCSDAFKRAKGRVGDGISDFVVGACPTAFRPHEIIFSIFYKHKWSFDVILRGDFLVKGTVIKREQACEIWFEFDHIAVLPTAVIHVESAVFIFENKLIYRLSTIDNIVN
ncbi:hypothetical protein D3C81_944590 [compost metagenome]